MSASAFSLEADNLPFQRVRSSSLCMPSAQGQNPTDTISPSAILFVDGGPQLWNISGPDNAQSPRPLSVPPPLWPKLQILNLGYSVSQRLSIATEPAAKMFTPVQLSTGRVCSAASR